MRAIVIPSSGSGPTLQELPRPEPQPGEVLIQVAASSVNGVDLYTARRAAEAEKFPVGLGKDFAGTVVATGRGVTRFSTGDRVFGWLAKPGPEGTFADYIAVPETLGIAPLPEGLDFASAGALGLAGTAALMAVEAVAPKSGETVLISGATGGVGAFAVQLTVAHSAEVMATAQSGDEAEFVRTLGAGLTVDYSTDLADSVRFERPNGVHSVIHLAGDGLGLAELLVPGGRIASTLGLGPDRFDGRDLVATAVFAAPDPSILERLAREAADGRLRVPITQTYGIEDVPKGLAAFAAGTLGKLAIAISR